MLSLLEGELVQNWNIYKDYSYNSVRLAQTLLERNMRICSTMRANGGISHDLEGEGKYLKQGSQSCGGMATSWCKCGRTRLV
jgi:hypothetical protein